MHKEIIRLIKDSNKRIARNASASRYRSLLKWINDYVSWNISRAASSLDFGMDRKEDIDGLVSLINARQSKINIIRHVERTF